VAKTVREWIAAVGAETANIEPGTRAWDGLGLSAEVIISAGEVIAAKGTLHRYFWPPSDACKVLSFVVTANGFHIRASQHHELAPGTTPIEGLPPEL
jgi:hypothetical protein